ncbi:hypothetical protein MTBBW1_760060 [Desulfamplus magnetovallimortis]|uniref:Uncharacterized protein n=1 Tax=Desulfamplus magnetovallimortis TaxID=1246637 RepID=A0A1W1HJH7_9BACT|nr:hypothetical protein [Desulfamplus magnetovallimortis]SLM32596.1 hypothetical protein MTBBW1_760060 [Desulfamplus magnetovallimortis]
MEIVLHLKRFCLETACKRLYERLIKSYFNQSQSDENRRLIEEKMAILLHLLENADFPALRQTYPELSGTEPLSSVSLYADGDDNGVSESISFQNFEGLQNLPCVKIVLNGSVIEPLWKHSQSLQVAEKKRKNYADI